MVKENIHWGYRRIAVELKKLGLHAGATTVKRILREPKCKAIEDYRYDCKYPAAKEVEGLERVVSVSSGLEFVLALQEDGSVWGWGALWGF